MRTRAKLMHLRAIGHIKSPLETPDTRVSITVKNVVAGAFTHRDLGHPLDVKFNTPKGVEEIFTIIYERDRGESAVDDIFKWLKRNNYKIKVEDGEAPWPIIRTVLEKTEKA